MKLGNSIITWQLISNLFVYLIQTNSLKIMFIGLVLLKKLISNIRLKMVSIVFTKGIHDSISNTAFKVTNIYCLKTP